MTYEQYITLFDKLIDFVKFLAPIIAATLSGWMLLQQSKIKAGLELNRETTVHVGATLNKKIDTNTDVTQETKEKVEDAAVTAKIVKTTLEATQEKTHEKLAEIADVGITTRKLVNGNMAKKLRKIATLAQRIAHGADATPEDIADAEQAEKEARAHEMQEEEIEKIDKMRLLSGNH